MEQARPHFLGIGAPKAGTTWLWSQLKKHPDVWLTPEKEMHFFDRSTAYPSPNRLATASFKQRLLGSQEWERPQVMKGLRSIAVNVMRGRFKRAAWWRDWTFGYYDEDWYVKLFSQARPNQVCGEISPSYSILEPRDIERIRAVNPEMRLIFMMRDPIDRAWSGLRYSASRSKAEKPAKSTEAMIARLETPLMLLRGDYERTLDHYLSVFDSSQILVCFYDAISRDPDGLIRSITSFLGIRDFADDTLDSKTPVNASPKREMPDAIRDHLLARYSPVIHRLSQRFGSYAASWESLYGLDSPADNAGAGVPAPPALHP